MLDVGFVSHDFSIERAMPLTAKFSTPFLLPMSNRLAKKSLDLLLKSNHADKPKRNATEKKSLKIPATKNGLKKIKYELRYGQQQRAKAKLVKQQKKSNPLGR